MKKYEFTGEIKIIDEVTLRRIKAKIDFGGVKAGEIGGWIEKEINLSHDGNAWVTYSAVVSGNAIVTGDAMVSGGAVVSGNAWVSGSAVVTGGAVVSGGAIVSGSAVVTDSAVVSGNAWVSGNATVYDGAMVSGNAVVSSDAMVSGDAEISNIRHFFCISNMGSEGRTVSFMRSKEKNILVITGCFYGILEEFKDAVINKHGNNQYAKEYLSAIEFAKVKIDLT